MLASGSLKEVAHQYGVSYPTVRLRLDKLIQKIRLSEETAQEPYIALIKRLAVGRQARRGRGENTHKRVQEAKGELT